MSDRTFEPADGYLRAAVRGKQLFGNIDFDIDVPATTLYVTWFLPLLERGSIPDGHTSVRFRGDLPPELERVDVASYWPPGGPLPPDSNFAQVTFRNVELPFSESFPPLQAALRLAKEDPPGFLYQCRAFISRARVFGRVAAAMRQSTRQLRSSARTQWLVAECSTLIPSPFDSEGWGEDEALAFMLAFVRDIQVNAELIGGQPMTLLEFAALPPFIVRRVRLPSEKPGSGTLSLIFTGTGLYSRLPPTDLSRAAQSRFLQTAHAYDEPSLLTDAQVLLGQAKRAIEDRGEGRTALINCETSVQVALDSLLMCAMWEEGTSVAEAARLYEATGLLARVRKLYSSRFGGNWALDGDGVVAQWHATVSIPRHRAVHLAEQVSQDAALNAIDVASRVLAFVDERLGRRDVRARYPITSALMNRHGVSKPQMISDGEIRRHYTAMTLWRQDVFEELSMFKT